MLFRHRRAKIELTAFTAVAAALAVVLAPAAPAVAAPSQCRPVLTGITAPELMHAGDKATGDVSLSCAPSSTVRILLSSDRSQLAVPGSVTVRPGQASAKVPLKAELVDGPQYKAQITARYNGRSSGDDLTVNPGLKSMGIPASSAPNSVSVQWSFTGPAPAGGLTVGLASDHPAVTVPATEFSQVGSYGSIISSARVLPVTEDTKVTISVTLGSRSLSASKTLVPPFDGTQGMNIQADGSGALYGLEYDRQYQVVLNNPAPENGLQVEMKVRGDDPAVRLDGTTDYIVGGNTTGYFRLNTADVTRTTHVVLEATAAGATATLPITIHPRITAVTFPDQVKGGTAFQGTVTLAGPSEVDTEVFLQPRSGGVDVQPSLIIPAGSTSARFEATSSAVEEPEQVTITAYLGRTEQSGTVNLIP